MIEEHPKSNLSFKLGHLVVGIAPSLVSKAKAVSTTLEGIESVIFCLTKIQKLKSPTMNDEQFDIDEEPRKQHEIPKPF